MTSITTTARRVFALALAGLVSTLSACGGFTSVDVGGSITGLTGTGLVLANGGSTVSPAPGATRFVFPNQVAIRDPYSVSVTTQPTQQTCAVFNPSGTAGAAPVTIVAVICSTNTYSVGGTVTGLTGTNLVLTNGSDQVTIPAGDANRKANFVFPVPVADGTAYGVAVLTQPAGQTCAVANGSAFMGGAPVTNVSITCQ